MARVIFPIYGRYDQDDFSWYRQAFEQRGFRLAGKQSESLLLSSDAVLLYCSGNVPEDGNQKALIETAVSRGIPFVLIHEPGRTGELDDLLKDAECISASHTDFERLRTLIDQRKKEPFADNHRPVSRSRIPEFLLVFLTVFVMAFFLIRISLFSEPGNSTQKTSAETVREIVQDAVVRVYAIGSRVRIRGGEAVLPSLITDIS